MAEIANKAAFTVSDGLLNFFNVDTLGLHEQITNADLSLTQSATAVALAGSGTIATAGIVVSRVSPASAVTGIIMAAGTQPGQLCLVVNEAVAANSVTFNATPGTSNVADSASAAPLYGLQARLFVWDSGTSLWYEHSPLNSGALTPLQSATAVALAGSGAIATANIGVSRVSPAAAVTGITMAAGTIPGQMVLVVNEAVVANTVTFNTTPATANVADSANEPSIPGLSARLYVWDSGTSLWYSALGANGPVVSATSPAVATSGTISTAGLDVSRVTPAGAVTAVVLQAGTYSGQKVWVINEAIAARSVTFDVAGTSNVADGASSAIAGVTARQLIWDSATSLWYRAG